MSRYMGTVSNAEMFTDFVFSEKTTSRVCPGFMLAIYDWFVTLKSTGGAESPDHRPVTSMLVTLTDGLTFLSEILTSQTAPDVRPPPSTVQFSTIILGFPNSGSEELESAADAPVHRKDMLIAASIITAIDKLFFLHMSSVSVRGAGVFQVTRMSLAHPLLLKIIMPGESARVLVHFYPVHYDPRILSFVFAELSPCAG